jgi:hypothetical protein
LRGPVVFREHGLAAVFSHRARQVRIVDEQVNCCGDRGPIERVDTGIESGAIDNFPSAAGPRPKKQGLQCGMPGHCG